MSTNKKTICIYLHVHQPFRLNKLNYLKLGEFNDYFFNEETSKNKEIFEKVAQKSYLPTNTILYKLLKKYPDFNMSLSITGTVIEQFVKYNKEILTSFKDLTDTGRVEILAETYYHSLASLYSPKEFAEQVTYHRSKINELFGLEPNSFRNTELVYSDYVAALVKELGFKTVIAEGWEKNLEWRSPNFVYHSKPERLEKEVITSLKPYKISKNIGKLKLLLKNYKLSDDIAFRFSNQGWEEYPLTVEKYLNWLEESPGELVNLFMDYETFGEHQWEDTGIFIFLENFIEEAIKRGHKFKTIDQAAKKKSHGELSYPDVTSWADLERDLSAWNGNKMQQFSLEQVYNLEKKIMGELSVVKNKSLKDKLTDEWRKLQTSDHFYYMSTKYWSDGDVHKYFSPYDSPYEAFINFMNILEDFTQKLDYEIGKTAHAKKDTIPTIN